MATAHHDVNLFDRAVVADPYPVYEQIRAHGNVVRNDLMQIYMVVGYHEAREALMDTGERFGMANDAELTPWFEGANMINVDGDEHDRLRRILAPHFTRQAIAGWERRVSEVVDELMTPLLAQGRFDIVSDFTLIPTIIVAEMMGVPHERAEDLRRWSQGMLAELAYGHESPDAFARLRAIGDEANGYLSEELERHLVEQPDDLITVMQRSNNMSPAEIRSTGLLLVLAGYDTTAKFLANSLVLLAQHPDQRAAIVEDMSLLPMAIEEVMRCTGPTQINPRRIMQDTTLGGVDMQAGEIAFVLQTAANRDPSRWEDPLRFDIRREPKSHVGFGFGPHLCLGAALARLEATTALRAVLEGAPDYEVHDVDYGTGMVVRGPERGHVEVRASVPA
jgi:cytochrome P450